MKNENSTAVTVNGTQHASVKAACEALGVSANTVSARASAGKSFVSDAIKHFAETNKAT